MNVAMGSAAGGGDEAWPRSVCWIHEVVEDGALMFRAGRCGDEMIAEWPCRGVLTCDHDGNAARFVPVAGASGSVVEKLERAQVRALLRDLAGGLSLHASAVSVEGRGVVFLGGDGAGKSTAAAEMCLGHGAVLYADDVAFLDVSASHAELVPGEGSHWLTDDSLRAVGGGVAWGPPVGQKVHVAAPRVAREPCSLAFAVVLRFDDSVAGPELRPLRGSRAARTLLEASLRFDLEDGAARGRELAQLMALHHVAPLFELLRRRSSPGGVAPFVHEALRGWKR